MSPRPRKTRNFTAPFQNCAGMLFKPAGVPADQLEKICLLRDELEALFLCDVRELSQQQAGDAMGVSRGTVQRLLSSGRRKLVEAVIGRKAITMTDCETLHRKDILHHLTEAAIKANNDCDLPQEVVSAVKALTSQPESLKGKETLIGTLISQIEEYDPYAGVGCFGGGTSLDDIRRTLKILED